MNFEEALKHYRERIATPEEKEYVESEIAKAKALSSLLDDEGINVKPAPIAEADKHDLKKVKKKFRLNHFVYFFAGITILLVMTASILGGVFGSASNYANSRIVYGVTESKQIALDYTLEYARANGLPSALITDFKVDGVDKDFEYEVPIYESYYGFVVEVNHIASDTDYHVYVNSVTGEKYMKKITR